MMHVKDVSNKKTTKRMEWLRRDKDYKKLQLELDQVRFRSTSLRFIHPGNFYSCLSAGKT